MLLANCKVTDKRASSQKEAKERQTVQGKPSQVTFEARCAPGSSFTFKTWRSFLNLLLQFEETLNNPHIFVSLCSGLNESLTERRPEARRCPLTLLCHSCDRPLVSVLQRWVSRVFLVPVGSSR